MLVHTFLPSGFLKRAFCFAILLGCLVLVPLAATAQYIETDLISTATDSNLVDGWGLTYFPASPWWVSNQNTSTSTLFTANGSIVPWLSRFPVSLRARLECPAQYRGYTPLLHRLARPALWPTRLPESAPFR
jgi:hypothetical protein